MIPPFEYHSLQMAYPLLTTGHFHPVTGRINNSFVSCRSPFASTRKVVDGIV